jgi:hypothetical protein
VPKQTYKITAFHGGINSNSDPRDINEYESVSLVDANIDKVGKITTLGSTSDSASSGASTIQISANRGLYVMKSDRQLDDAAADDTLLFNFNAADGFINARDSDDSSDWHEDVIEFAANASPVYYSSDGNLRVGDFNLSNNGKFFGYIADSKFSSLGASSGTVGWYDSSQYVDKPSVGKVLVSTPYAGSDTQGENSANSEYIGSYVNDADSPSSDVELMSTSAVNLRVGVQYNTALETNSANWNTKTNCTANVSTTNYISLFEDTNVLVTGASTTSSNTVSDTDGVTFTVNTTQAFVFGLWFTTTEYDKLSHVEVVLSNASNNITYKFLSENMVGEQKWNIFSCSQLNITTQTAAFDDVFTIWSVKVEQKSGHSGDDSPDYWFSGPIIAPIEPSSGFPSGLYSFHHSYLYDDAKQESLLKQFTSGDGTYGINEVNILGSPILFNFDVYVNPFSSRQMLTDQGIDISADTIDKTSHGLKNGDTVKFEGIKNAGAISNNTLYYVVGKADDTFQLSATKSGSAITITGADDPYVTGTAQAGASGTITLASGESGDDDAYNTYIIYISSGTGAGQYRVISDYTGSSKVAAVNLTWKTNPASDSVYKISPAYRYYALNKRIVGSRIYYKIETNDNYFLIGEVDFVNNGFKWFPEADVLSYDASNTSSTAAPVLNNTSLVKGIAPTSSNNIDTYKTINGFSNTTDWINARYKTAVVHGRRVYIGNIKRPNARTYPDRIIKSQINKFDVFPSGLGSVDVAIRDGESIVKLEAYADRILQFKEHSLYIINVSETVDFLEDTLRNKGCAFDYHVTKTDFGIAWFNIHGVYFYDGQKVTNLLERSGMMVINESDWETFITNSGDTDISEAHIGFIPKKRQLIINNQATHIFIYDFVLGSWMKGSTKLAVTTNRTNFALDSDQDLFYLTGTASTIRKWSPSAAASSGFEIITKDIDFGEPAVRKKVYRVYITYKTGGTTNVTVKYDTNGDTGLDKVFQDGTNFASNVIANAGGGEWTQAILKPNTSSEANNIYSFALKIYTTGTVPATFQINDITIIYRMKNIR